MRVRSILAGATTVALLLAIGDPGVATASPSGKAAPPGAAVGQYDKTLARPLTAAEFAAMKPRSDQAAAYYRAKTSAAGATTTSRNLAEPYLQQVNEDFCGAATTAMISDYLGFGWTGYSPTYQENQAGFWVKTDGAYKDSAGTIHFPQQTGTNWYGVDNVPSYPYGSYYPIQDWLNYRLYVRSGHVRYVATPLPGSPSATDQSNFVARLVTDIDASYPQADNQYSIPGYQLPYQPNGTWYHWWSARGYQNSGHTTGINDPAAWSHNAEHWVTTTGGAHTVVVALGGRGYIW